MTTTARIPYWLGVLALVFGCEQVLGIQYTSSGDPSGGADARAGASADAGAGAETGGSGGGAPADNQAGGSAGAEEPLNNGGAPNAGGMAGQPSGGETTSSAGKAAAGSSGGELSPANLPLGSLSLWLEAGQGVTTTAGTVATWRDQSQFESTATPPEAKRAPKLVPWAFGSHPGVHFDGKDDRLTLPDAVSLQVGTSPFVLELVVLNESTACCQQMIFFKEERDFPYRGITAAVNSYISPHDTVTIPPSGEFATFLTLEPDFVSTPFSDSADYRDGKPRVLSMLRTASELSIRVNGQVLGSIASTRVDASAIGQDVTIGGCFADGPRQFRGSIAEIVLAQGLKTEDALSLDRFLVAKYADVLDERKGPQSHVGFHPGDMDGDGRADIALIGGPGWTTVPIAHSLGNGTFSFINEPLASFPSWASEVDVKKLSGDFNGDGKTDMLLTGGGFTTIPVALSQGDTGTFNVVDEPLADFTTWASLANVKAVVGDFDGDRRDDIALAGNALFTGIPIAFSNGDGTFSLTNQPLATFEKWSATSGAVPVSGDFNYDGRDDIALVGGSGFTALPIATATFTRGVFTVSDQPLTTFQAWAQFAGSVPIGGDFDGDGYGDIALVGSPSFTTVPVAINNGSGGFALVNQPLADFTTFASWANVKAVPGDFNGDGRTDIALIGGNAFTTTPIAFASATPGLFTLSNRSIPSFPSIAAIEGAVPLSGHKAQ